MNRRGFLKVVAARSLGAALPVFPNLPATAASLRAGEVQSPNVGPGLLAGAPYQKDGVWYVDVAGLGFGFTLKSYDGRRWATLDWQPRRSA